MAILNLHKKEVECKIVYYGPGRCGKTTNLEYIYKTYKKQIKGEMLFINTDTDRTLFFDFLPIEFGKIKGCDIKVKLFTVPGQVKYKSTRKLVLRGVDGVVFVADSLRLRREKNIESLKDLHENLKSMGLSILHIPLVMQYNKRDLENTEIPLMPVEQMERDLNRQLKAPSFPASAVTGQGVGPTLSKCLKLTITNLYREFKWGQK
ncbi:MAG: GTPase domain-containing protein [Desulfobacteraceae bacterium]|nr:GTPase domain-containing protein [Desulfobacteraceae bacterium]